MTLVFSIEPRIARDFSLMIQSVGMSAAALAIGSFKIKVDRPAVIWAGSGGVIGVMLGLSLVAPHVPAAAAKMFFTSLWLSFAVALYLIERSTALKEEPGSHDAATWVLVLLGVVGGVVSSVIGSGLDILVFSYLVLRRRLSVSVATPTSVILMAVCSVAGTLFKTLVLGGIEPAALNYWAVCVPVVVIGAPLGAWFISDKSQWAICRILYGSIIIQTIGAFALVEQTPQLLALSAATFSLGGAFFLYSSRLSRDL